MGDKERDRDLTRLPDEDDLVAAVTVLYLLRETVTSLVLDQDLIEVDSLEVVVWVLPADPNAQVVDSGGWWVGLVGRTRRQDDRGV